MSADIDFTSNTESLLLDADAVFARIQGVPESEKIDIINAIREKLHLLSPFKDEPVDFVRWIKADNVEANDYNPNTVAPPEMELLAHSILVDGYTQPIVSWPVDDGVQVIDGFHRNRVGKESPEVAARVKGYLPIVEIKPDRSGKGDRIAATIRHNRARGKHAIDAMSDIVIELKRRNWSNNKIAKELGMDADEVLRLCQITGMVELFADAEFSEGWDAVIMSDDDFSVIDEDDVRALGNADPERIFHEWDKWECYPAGFYGDHPPNGWTTTECEEKYRDFLACSQRFSDALARVLEEWPNSCQHYLSNGRMNRIAWLGQAAMCIETGVPSRFCGGYNLLTEEQKEKADETALDFLNHWLERNGRDTISSVEDAASRTQMNLY